jgi:hypothetical protein
MTSRHRLPFVHVADLIAYLLYMTSRRQLPFVHVLDPIAYLLYMTSRHRLPFVHVADPIAYLLYIIICLIFFPAQPNLGRRQGPGGTPQKT